MKKEHDKQNIVQLEFPEIKNLFKNLNTSSTINTQPEENKESLVPCCGDCGLPMTWDKKVAVGGRFICISHPV